VPVVLHWRHQATIVQFYIFVVCAEKLEYLRVHRVVAGSPLLAWFRSVEAVVLQPGDSKERWTLFPVALLFLPNRIQDFAPPHLVLSAVLIPRGVESRPGGSVPQMELPAEGHCLDSRVVFVQIVASP
jgi:hypothetical protein